MDKITKHMVAELTGYKLHTMDVSQGDRRSRQIRLRLLENGIPWSAPEGARVVVSYQLPDGTPGSYDTMPDGSPAGMVQRNVVTVQLADQLTAQAGAADVSVVLLGAEGQQLAMWPVRLRVVGPEKITIPENLPALGAGYEGKLLFGGEGGVLQPLALGTGLHIEDDALHAEGGPGGSSGPAYVASEEPPEDTNALWVDTAEPEEAVALGVTAVETDEGVELYCTDELGTTKVTVRHGKDGAPGAQGPAGPQGEAGPQGPQGEPGADYELTDEDMQQIAGLVPGGGEVWETIVDYTVPEDCYYVRLTTDVNGNPFSLRRAMVTIIAMPFGDGTTSVMMAFACDSRFSSPWGANTFKHGFLSSPKAETYAYARLALELTPSGVWATQIVSNSASGINGTWLEHQYIGGRPANCHEDIALDTLMSMQEKFDCVQLGSYAVSVGAGTRIKVVGVRA